MSGAVYLSGTPEQPIALKVPWVDFGTACLSAFGTLAALIERGKTGRGQKVEGALLRTAIAFANATLIEQALTEVNRDATAQPRLQLGAGRLIAAPDGWIVATVIGAADVPPLVPDDRRGALARRPALRRRPVARRPRRDHLGADEPMVRRAQLRRGARRAGRGQHRRRPGLFAAAGARRPAYPRRPPARGGDLPRARGTRCRWRRPRSSSRKPPAPTAGRRRCSASTPTRSSRSLGYDEAEIASPAPGTHRLKLTRPINDRACLRAEEPPAPSSSAAPRTLGPRRGPPTKKKAAAPRPNRRCAGRRDGTAVRPAASGRGR